MRDAGGAEAASDLELVQACLAGDRHAFDLLVHRHQGQIYRLCFRLCGGHEDAAELAQDAFVRAYRSLSTFKGESAFSTWLYRIAVNLSLNQRAKKALPVGELNGEHRSAGEGADAALIREERNARVRRAIAQLPGKQRATLVLRVYQDLAHEEIGRLLGTTAGASKANLFHALKRLKQLLDGER